MSGLPLNAWLPLTACAPDGTRIYLQFNMEQLTVLGLNSLSPLSFPPDGTFFSLIVNQTAILTPIGLVPDFALSGINIVWGSGPYSVNPGDTVIAAYTYAVTA